MVTPAAIRRCAGHHLGDGVGAKELVGVIGVEGNDALAGCGEHLRHVGQVKLGVGIVAGELVEVGEQGRGLEGVEAHVDFTERELLRGQHFLLDDGGDFRRAGRGMGALSPENNAAVACWVGRLSCGEGHGGLLGVVEGGQRGQGLGVNERSVAGEDQDVFVAGDGFAGTLDGVAGAALLGLVDEMDAGGGDGRFHFFCLVADDGEDVFRGDDLGSGGDYVGQERLAADFMQHFGAAGFEAGAFAGGHDDDGEVFRGIHLRLSREMSWLGFVLSHPCRDEAAPWMGHQGFVAITAFLLRPAAWASGW
jgi:hypothetical protein